MWRRESPHVLGALLRRHGDLADCEDAAQEALEAAARQWARDGMPDEPAGVADPRRVAAPDRPARADGARAAREEAVAVAQPATPRARAADDRPEPATTACSCCCSAAIRR